MTPEELEHQEQLTADKHARHQQLLERVYADWAARPHSPYRVADRAVGMPTRKDPR